MIIEEYDESLFISRFRDYKRVETLENPNGGFSYKGLINLFEYLDKTYSEENPFKLDVISLCCDFTEYKNLDEYLKNYSREHEETEFKGEGEDEKDFLERMEEEINDKTLLIKFESDLNEGFIIANY